MQRREFVRESSKAARWSLPPAVQSLVLALVATLMHWLDFLTSRNFVVVLSVAFVLAIAGFVLALLGFRALWVRAAIGGRRSALAVVLCTPMLLLGIATIILVQTTPRLSDISTDLLDPPHFNLIRNDDRFSNRLEPPTINAALQARYKGMTGRRYALSADMIARHAQELIVANGWLPATSLPERDEAGNWIIEAIVRTGVFGFRDAIVVRVIDEGEAAFVDMRSASGFGDSDLGENARRIRRFMADLDTQISLGPVSGQ